MNEGRKEGMVGGWVGGWTVNNSFNINLLYNVPFNATEEKLNLQSFLPAARSQFTLDEC